MNELTSRQYSAYFYILPCLFLFAVFLAYPLVYTIRISFYSWNGIDPTMSFNGLANYKTVLQDAVFYVSLRNFVLFAVLVIGVQMILGFLIAYFTRAGGRGARIYRTLIFIPVIITPSAISFLFSDLLEYNNGYLNDLLRNIGLSKLALPWIGDPHLSLYTVIAITVWSGTGFSMSVYASALTSLSSEVLEAARIDGASGRQTIVKVVWPMLRDAHYSLTIIGSITALKFFDLIYLLTRGGPDHATEMPSTYMFKTAFEQYDQGAASAVATLIIVMALAVTILQMRLSRNNAVGEI